MSHVSGSSLSIVRIWNPSRRASRVQRMTRLGSTFLICEYARSPGSTKTMSYRPESSTDSSMPSTSVLPLITTTFCTGDAVNWFGSVILVTRPSGLPLIQDPCHEGCFCRDRQAYLFIVRSSTFDIAALEREQPGKCQVSRCDISV